MPQPKIASARNDSTKRGKALRARRSSHGFMRYEVSVHKDDKAAVRAFVDALNEERAAREG